MRYAKFINQNIEFVIFCESCFFKAHTLDIIKCNRNDINNKLVGFEYIELLNDPTSTCVHNEKTTSG